MVRADRVRSEARGDVEAGVDQGRCEAGSGAHGVTVVDAMDSIAADIGEP